MPTIIEKIERCRRENRTCFSLEFFPPKTEQGVQNLYSRIERLKAGISPEFVDVTWGAGGSTAGLSMDIAATATAAMGLDVLLHMTCTNMTREQVREHLYEAKKNNITNVLALRGDPPHGLEQWTATEGGFEHAVDLVRFIRDDPQLAHFGIVVAGFPDGHLESPDLASDIGYLKEKVDAGADVVITQMFYDVDIFLQFVKNCREAGIQAPIVPGIMPIDGYQSFIRRTKFAQTKVPKWVYTALEPIKNDDAEVKAFGIKFITAMCRTLLNNGIGALHLYTMNLEKSVTVLYHALKSSKQPSIPRVPSSVGVTHTTAPSAAAAAAAAASTLKFSRSAVWDDFPNGFCGDSASPNWGEDPYHPVVRFTGQEPFYHEHSTIRCIHDVSNMVQSFLCNALPALPWSREPLSGESALVVDRLCALVRRSFFTISSQPAVHGASSKDSVFGWGSGGGHVYQKAYVQGICPGPVARHIIRSLSAGTGAGTGANGSEEQEQEQVHRFTFHMIDGLTGEHFSNCSNENKNTLTWGVWPGKEIVQVTYVDTEGFHAFAKEVFQTIEAWLDGFPAQNTDARRVVSSMLQDGWCCVHVVDEHFWETSASEHQVPGDLWDVMECLTGESCSKACPVCCSAPSDATAASGGISPSKPAAASSPAAGAV